MSDRMTARNRWLAAIRMEPVDRLPFWPKIGGAWQRAQAEPIADMPVPRVHDWIGSDRHDYVRGCLRRLRSRTSVESTREGDVQRTVFRAPSGELTRIDQFDQGSQAWHPVKMPVADLDEIRIMTEIERDVRIERDEDALAKAREAAERIGDDALRPTGLGTTSLMQWVEWIAGIENAHWLLADHPADVEALFDALFVNLRRSVEITAAESPADVVYLTENTSTTLISPEQFRRYCLPQIVEIGTILRAAGKPLILHMCGHLKDLLDDLATTPAAAFEAFTSPTLGNTTFLDGRTHCPETCLVGGTNAMLWTRPADEIIAQIEHDLAELPHHRGIVVTSAGVMPPMATAETIRSVCEWVKTYPVRMGAA